MSTEFQEFRGREELEASWAVSVEHLEQCVFYLYRKGISPGSIQGCMSALAFYAKVHGYLDSMLDCHRQKMLEGWSKERVRATDTQVPISPAVLVRINEQ